MKNQTLLFVMSDVTPDGELQEVLDQARTQNARVICLILSHVPTYPISAYGALPYGGMDASPEWIEELSEAKKRLKDRTSAVKSLLQKEGVSGDVHPAVCAPANVREIVARRALISDIATLAPSMREDNSELFYPAARGVLFEAPIGLILNALPLAKPKRIFLAWDTELQAARAAHVALPLLKAASEVVIGSIDPHAVEFEDGEDPGAELANWLSHHGCSVTVNQFPSGGKSVGEVIQNRAREVGADLVVMGAYGHSRVREFLFGGTTRTMIEQTDTPVFLAH